MRAPFARTTILATTVALVLLVAGAPAGAESRLQSHGLRGKLVNPGDPVMSIQSNHGSSDCPPEIECSQRNQLVGNGTFPVLAGQCDPRDQSELIPVNYHGHSLTGPRITSVTWPPPVPGGTPVDPRVPALTGDYVTDLFQAPSWAHVMEQYVGMTPHVFEGHFEIPELTESFPRFYREDFNRWQALSDWIAEEILRQAEAGALPPPDLESIYVVHMPPGWLIEDSDPSGIGRDCFDWCGYHDYYFQVSEEPYVFFTLIVMPDYADPGSGCMDPVGEDGKSFLCGGGSTFLDNYFQTVAHEIYETVSNPYGSGWRNDCSHRGGEEIGDLCGNYTYYAERRTFGPGAPQCPNRWGVQPAFSNEVWFASQADGGIDACQVIDAIEEETPCVETSECGDGVIDFGEACDAGGLNGTPASCCTEACTFAAAETPCDDGDACTEADRCDDAGACSVSNEVVCQPLDQCHDAGTCHPATGCDDPPKSDGSVCEDGDACTGGDTCQAGSCTSGTLVEAVTDPAQLLECLDQTLPVP